MPKSSRKQINEDGKKLLRILQQNSGNSIEQIAKKCGFTRQKVWRIKKRLEKNKTIWGYSAVTDYNNMDLLHYTVLFKRTPKPLNKEIVDDVTKGYLEDKFPEGNINIENVLYVHGEYDWIISFTAPNINMMKKFCEILMNTFGDFIDSYSVHETMISIRKQGIKNPISEKEGKFL
ncbi:MAG: Lrp/AsnC family transcriptional regulator [Thermoplasmatales archaeon]|nr:MAG: Lrp/AsnC family transcriptional regulator [Thermoplasmatales archaeon]